MSSRARLWIGSTLLIVILANYALIGTPLLLKSNSIKTRTKAILVKQAKSGGIFSNTDDDYLLDLFRREKAAIDAKLTMLNVIALTLIFFTASWTIFGLVFKRK